MKRTKHITSGKLAQDLVKCYCRKNGIKVPSFKYTPNIQNSTKQRSAYVPNWDNETCLVKCKDLMRRHYGKKIITNLEEIGGFDTLKQCKKIVMMG